WPSGTIARQCITRCGTTSRRAGLPIASRSAAISHSTAPETRATVQALRDQHRRAKTREDEMSPSHFGWAWLAVAAAVLCSGPASAAEPTPTPGGEAVFGLEADWHPMDPLRADAVDDADVDYAIYDTLLKVTPGGEIKPGLATGYTVSQDGLTYELTLRPGLKFQDGTPLDAAAVKFNLERELDPKNDCWCRAFISSIASVDAKDKEHVVLHLAKPYAPLPYTLASIFGGLLASPTAIQKYGKDYGNHPVGAGPFRFVSQQTGNYVTVERWDGYWEKGYPH